MWLLAGVVAIEAEKFPVAAIGWVVVVVMVAVMHGQFAQIGDGKLAGTAAANPRVHFQGALAVTFGADISSFAGVTDDLVKAFVVC